MATAMGPMPPGTGVKIEATLAHAGSASPISRPEASEVPASISTTPCFNISGVISPGSPAPETTISASCSSSSEPCFCVITETRAPKDASHTAAGVPTRRPAPTTTAFLPRAETPVRTKISDIASTTGGCTIGFCPIASTSSSPEGQRVSPRLWGVVTAR